uniref:Uncharacterized protein n=1 Tax=Arundo donax TaxID=35708 RepID=A0A0A9DC63_ARUDO
MTRARPARSSPCRTWTGTATWTWWWRPCRATAPRRPGGTATCSGCRCTSWRRTWRRGRAGETAAGQCAWCCGASASP